MSKYSLTKNLFVNDDYQTGLEDWLDEIEVIE